MLEGLLNELGIADLSTFEAVLLHDTGAVLDAIRSTAAAAEAGGVRRLMPAQPRAMLWCPQAPDSADSIAGYDGTALTGQFSVYVALTSMLPRCGRQSPNAIRIGRALTEQSVEAVGDVIPGAHVHS